MDVRRTVLPVSAAFLLFGCVWFAPLTEHAHAAVQAPAVLPPLQYTCPMHPEILEDAKGSCPICKMALEPTRIDTDLNYSCPNHPAVITLKPGLCPLDRRELVPVVVTLHWTCPESPDQKLMDPGKCASGATRKLVKQIRAHGDHNPRYGGLFYMAADQWHHLEGAYPRAGVFRVYFYDNYTQPIDAKGFTGRVIVGDESFPLKPSRDGKKLEAGLKSDKPPSPAAPFTPSLKLKFNADAPEQQFDFRFEGYSVAPASAPATSTTTGASARPAPASTPAPTTTGASAKPASAPTTSTTGATAGRPAPASATTAAAASTTESTAPTPSAAVPTPAPQPAPAVELITNCEPNMTRTDALLLSDSLPKNSKALLGLLDMCGVEVAKLIDGRQFGFVYQPTMLGKDIALALENYVGELPESRRVAAADAIRRTVLAAWQLDMYGDMGNQEKLAEANTLFAAAVAAIKTAYGAQP